MTFTYYQPMYYFWISSNSTYVPMYLADYKKTNFKRYANPTTYALNILVITIYKN